jgi:hypothetical protein
MRDTVIKSLTLIVWTLGALCSSGLMIFVGGGWKQGVLGYVAWALMPYLTIAIILLCARFFHLSRPVKFLLSGATMVISTIGPLLYLDALFVHVDAQGALAILMIPVIQILLTLLVMLMAVYWHWRISRHTRKPADSSKASPLFPIPRIMIHLNKPLRILLASAMTIFVLVYALISRLQNEDLETIAIAGDVDTFILQYCINNKVLPTSGVLQKQFPNLNRESGWFFYTDDTTYLKIQYPMQWWNSQAIGEPRISEFTATVYAYIVDYKCGEAHDLP